MTGTVRPLFVVFGVVAGALLFAGTAAAYVPHGPIVIGSNDSPALDEFPGSGTRSDPYVISGLEIAATERPGVNISGTNVSIVLRDLRIANGGSRFDGIVLSKARNVTIEDTILEGNRNGIAIKNSSSILVRRVNVNSTSVGVLMEGAREVTVRDGVFPQNEKGVSLRSSVDNVFERNRITLASGQFGFWFADEKSVVNAIHASNLVNEVPMRWIVNSRGITVSGAHVDVKGITNLAQMLVYASDRIRIEDALLTNGTARGLVIWRSEDVVVAGTNASLNEGHGIYVNASRRVRVEAADASVNGGDGIRVDGGPPGASGLARNEVVGLVAVGNKGRAVALFNTSGARLHGIDALANEGGVLANRSRELSVSESRILDSRGVGVNVSQPGSNLTLVDLVVRENAGDGIRVRSAGAGYEIRGNEVGANGGRGLFLERTVGRGKVSENEIADNGKAGVQLLKTFGARFDANLLSGNPRGIQLGNSSNNTFASERIVKNDSSVGLWFDDVFSYDNPVSPNSTVNGAPVQWLVRRTGTQAAPFVVADVAVEGANVTNVAQIGLHNSSWVRLLRPVAANGSGVGIFLHQSHDVHVLEARVHDNARSGILVRANTTVFEARAASNVLENVTVARNGGAATDAGVKFQGSAATGNVLRGALVHDNSPAGVRLEQAGARNVVERSVVRANEAAGLVLDRSTLTTIQGNRFEDHARVVDLAGSVTNLFQENALAIGNGSFGFFFRDEASYSNDILPNTTVNGVGMQWFTFVDGREGAPVVLRPKPVELAGITNVGQVVVYKSSWLRLEGAVAGNGTGRGVFLVKSSQVEVANATLRSNPVGVELWSTLASRVSGARVVGGNVGVLVNASSGNTVVDTAVEGTKTPVRLVASEDNRVWATNASGVSGTVVIDDASRSGAAGENLLVDAGLDQSVPAGAPVEFAGLAVSPFRNQPVVLQHWDFGDGTHEEFQGANASRPSHAFEAAGRYVVRLTVQTPSATYADTVVVTVEGTDGDRVRIVCEPPRREAAVGEETRFDCTATLVGGGPHVRTVPVDVEGAVVANLTVDVPATGNASFVVSYTPQAAGEHTLWIDGSTVVRVSVAGDGAADEKGLPAVGAVGAALALGLAARRRRS